MTPGVHDVPVARPFSARCHRLGARSGMAGRVLSSPLSSGRRSWRPTWPARSPNKPRWLRVLVTNTSPSYRWLENGGKGVDGAAMVKGVGGAGAGVGHCPCLRYGQGHGEDNETIPPISDGRSATCLQNIAFQVINQHDAPSTTVVPYGDGAQQPSCRSSAIHHTGSCARGLAPWT